MKNHYLTRFFALVFFLGATISLTNAQTFTVTAPASVAGEYAFGTATFGPQFDFTLTGEVVEITDIDGLTTGCVAIDNGATDVTGKIAMIDRGACAFTAKVLNAQTAGAIGVLICDNDTANPDAVAGLGGDDMCQVTIPAVRVSYNTCQTLRVETGLMAEYVGADAPSAGEHFDTAIDIGEGLFTVDAITGTGGLFAGSVGAAFYAYTPSAIGVATFSSCGGGADTRLIVGQGDCAGSFTLLNFSIDDCDDGNGNVVASTLDMLVFPDQTYYLLWDDAQSAAGFDFSVNLSALPVINATFTLNVEDVATAVTAVDFAYSLNSDNSANIGVAATDNGDGTWSATIPITTLDTVYHSWSYDDGGGTLLGESVPEECSIVNGDGVRVRSAIIGNITDVSLPTVCYALCTNCPSVNATFTVDMSNETVSGAGVTMAWGTAPEDQNVTPLTDNGDGTWSATIGVQTGDTVGYFFANGANPITDLEAVPEACGVDSGAGFNTRIYVVEGFDDLVVDNVCYGTCSATCPSDSPCADPGPDVVFCDDFDSGTDQWTLEGAWGLSNTQSNSGSSSLTDSPGGNYAANLDISATMTNGVDLSAALDANLSFDAIYDIEGGNFDFCYVEASTDGGTTWTNVATFLGQDNLTPWVTYEYSLGGFVGNADVRIRFRFNSDGGFEVDGIYIDNFFITASDQDNAPPLILHTPPALYASQLGDITQTAQIIDISGLGTVEALYSVDGVAQTPVAGTDEGGNMWSFVIPAQEAGAQVDYAVRAVDASDNANEITSATFSYIAGNHIFYDNGVVNFVNDIGAQAAGEQAAAVRISIDGTTQISYALIRNYTDTGRPNDSIDVHIWADNNGVPGADLIDPIRVFPEANLQVSNPMTRVDLRPFADQLTGEFGDVFVGYTCDSVAWLVQTTPPIANRTFTTADGTTWTQNANDFHFRLVTGGIIPADNSCGGATDVTNQLGGGLDVVVSSGPYDNTNYTSDGDPEDGWDCFGEPDGGGAAPSLERTVWFSFTGDGNTYFIEANECGDDPIDFGDTQIAIYTGDCGGLTPVACVDDGPNAMAGGPFPAGLEFETEEGVTYYMFVDGFGPDFPADGEFCLEFTQLTQNSVEVTFQVDMTNEVNWGAGVSAEGVFLSGEFNGWPNPGTAMTDLGNNIWSVTLSVPANDTLEYKYQNGTDGWEEELGGSEGGPCTLGDTNNRFVETATDAIQLDPVCFNQCLACNLLDIDVTVLENGVSIFPNPAKEILNVRFDLSQATDNLHLRMVNTLGQTVYTTKLGQVQAENVEVNVSELPSGAYMIQLIDGETQVSKSVVVE